MLLSVLTSCSKAPEYADIEGRLKELVEASAEINTIFFGTGLPTYERVYDPRSTTDVYRDKVIGEDGKEEEILYYYYEVYDKDYSRVIAYRSDFTKPFTYVYVVRDKEAGKEAVFANDSTKYYAYALEGYVEPEYDFYYMSDDPTDYDYVRHDSKFTSVDQIKYAAEQVYSKEYLSSIYDSMFIGTLSASGGVSGLEARYIEYADDDGGMSLMMSNEFEPFITETRQFDYSTARIVRPSNRKFVSIEIESYLPSAPNDRLTVTLTLILQDGQWMLDSATY